MRRLVMAMLVGALAGGSGACSRGGSGGGAGQGGTGGDAASARALADLAREYWDGYLAAHPVHATLIGVRKYDDQLDDITPEGRARERARLEDVLARARAIPEEPLAPPDRLTRTALITEIDGGLARLDCGLEEWTVDPLEGPQVGFMNIESFQPVRTIDEGRAMIRRWRAMGPWLDAHMANLRSGLAAGKVAVRDAVQKVIGEVDDLVARKDAEWALLAPLKTEHREWTGAERAEFRDGLSRAVAESVRPAFVRYGRFLTAEILPRARPQDKPGLLHVPGGAACYTKLIRVHTSLELDPEKIHQTGLDEVARINREMEALGKRVLGTPDRKATLHRLRTDPALTFRTPDEVAAKAEAALAKAKAAIPAWFGRLPRADCQVARIEKHEEKYSTIAYYREPAADGSRPGRYYINTSAPGTRPRYEAEALAYHESIPGHHLQIAIAQELTGVPDFRRFTGVTAYVEGWGLYAERLSDEMGLYSADLDRIGMLSYDAWRACRLVVDTGMHAKGWTRRQAIDFMLENTALAENNIGNEVDRYIVWPGQALAYKLGQLEILRLREDAKKRLGERFDIKAFHDAVLENGAVALEPLRRAVDDYVARASAR